MLEVRTAVNDLICRNIVQFCSEIPALRTNMLPLFSGSKVVGLIFRESRSRLKILDIRMVI